MTISAQQLPITVGNGIATYRFEIEDGLTVQLNTHTGKLLSAEWDKWVPDEHGDGEWIGVPVAVSEIIDLLPDRLFS
jgi:hypothetical protein